MGELFKSSMGLTPWPLPAMRKESQAICPEDLRISTHFWTHIQTHTHTLGTIYVSWEEREKKETRTTEEVWKLSYLSTTAREYVPTMQPTKNTLAENKLYVLWGLRVLFLHFTTHIHTQFKAFVSIKSLMNAVVPAVGVEEVSWMKMLTCWRIYFLQTP